jgi:phosphatidylethanolamine-binding protein (PEBP) family uncharacterized protein
MQKSFRKIKFRIKIKKIRKTKKKVKGGGSVSICYSVGCNLQTHTVESSSKQPTIQFDKSIQFPVLILMYDPDAPAKSWIHWIAKYNSPNDLITFLDYQGPNPPSNTGRQNSSKKYYHEYIFNIYQNFNHSVDSIPTVRGNFSINKFFNSNKIVNIPLFESKSFRVYC